MGGTLNDAFVASVSGGLRRYHEVHMSRSRSSDHHPTAPANRLTQSAEIGSRSNGSRCSVGTVDAVERVRLPWSERCRVARNDRAQPLSDASSPVP